MTNFRIARQNMVEGQIRSNKVTDGVLIEALRNVPREEFVPTDLRGVAYVDEDLRIGGGRYLMEPMVMARLIQAAQVSGDDIVLDIGCATGYSCAILAGISDTVVGLECDEKLASEANDVLNELDIGNAAVVTGNLVDGYPKQAPYNVIMFGGSIDQVPEAIADQLAEGGRVVAVVRRSGPVGQAMLFIKIGGLLSGRPLFDASTPYLPGLEPAPSFVF